MKDESPVTLEAQLKVLAQTYKAIMRQYGQVLNARENIKEEVKVMPQTMSANDAVVNNLAKEKAANLPSPKIQKEYKEAWMRIINNLKVKKA